MSKKYLIILIVIILAVLGVGIYGLWMKSQQGLRLGNLGTDNLPMPLGADWISYRNEEYKFEIKYPYAVSLAEGNTILNWESDKITDLRFSIEFLDKDPNISLETFVSKIENPVWHYEHAKIVLPSGVEVIKQTWTHQLSGINYFINLNQTRILLFRSVKPDTDENEIPYFNQILSTFRFLE